MMVSKGEGLLVLVGLMEAWPILAWQKRVLWMAGGVNGRSDPCGDCR